MGELHLDIKVDILKRTYKVDANIGAPQVAYREKITRPATVDYTAQEADRRSRPVRRASRSSPSRGAPGSRASSSKTRSSAARCRRNSFPAVEKGLEAVLGSGVLAGFPVVDLKVSA